MMRNVGKVIAISAILVLLVLRLPAQESKPKTFLVDPQALSISKDKISQGDAEYLKAKAGLLQAADEACKRGPYTVVSKTKIPPSGDKHDYMSVGPYWWPDTTKPDGLPYIRRDGVTNPERHQIKDADHMKDMSHDVKLLGIAYYFSADDKYAAHAAKLLKTWFLHNETKMNPNLNYGQAIPGITDGRGIGIIDTKCLVDVIDGAQLITGSGSWRMEDHKALQSWFRQYLDWLINSPLGKDEADEHNNHGTYYDVQTIAYALFTGNDLLAKEILKSRTMPRIESQLKEDGSQPFELARTKSKGYCTMNLRGFFALAAMAKTVGVDLWNHETPTGKSIKKAFLWMLPYVTNEKSWQQEQIVPFDWNIFLPLLRIAAQRYPDIDLLSAQSKLRLQGHEQYLSLLANTMYH